MNQDLDEFSPDDTGIIRAKALAAKGGGRRLMQVEAIAHGTVIDHIPAAATVTVAMLLARPDDQIFIGVNLRSDKLGRKGVVKVAGVELSPTILSRLALLCPSASMAIIRDYKVVDKGPIPMPDAFVSIARCPNMNCVTNSEQWVTRFDVVGQSPLVVRCRYCERSVPADELSLL